MNAVPGTAWTDSGDERATVYHRRQFWLAVGTLLITIACLAAVLGGGLTHWTIPGPPPPWWVHVAALAVVLGVGLKLLTLPLDWARGYWLPKRFGLLHQPFGRWCWDRVKAGAIGGLLALAAVEIVYGFLRVSPWWWLWAALILFVGSLLLTVVVPVWIIPLFYRLVPLEDAALNERLLELARRGGVAVVGVWVADQSRKSRTANAALTGLGRTRRILLFDTLIAEFTPEEIESVLAHELGHHVHGDVRRGLLIHGALLLATFWTADGLLRTTSAWFGFQGSADPAGLPLLALILLFLGLMAAPLANGFSRRIEIQADDFALATTRNSRAFVSAMERLASLNLAERRPHRLKEFFLYSHPSIDRRIKRAERFLSPHPISPQGGEEKR
ncbi:MAG: M48 family metalloprotease [Candidatus Rokubacteria bacterium]|nr:M48 family metalloprotease [Candidatus Rokubacteria bacterium]